MSCFIIAEAGVNHCGSEELALELVKVARDSGADAVKFQTFNADCLVVPQSAAADYQEKATGQKDQHAMLQQLELSALFHAKLAAHCSNLGIEFMSTAFDEPSVDLLVELGVRRLKVPSGEITNFPLIKHLASKDLPLILSTGMSNLKEIVAAVREIKRTRDSCGHSQPLSEILTVLHCTSAYPAPFEDLNLRALATIQKELRLPVGYSDHSQGILVGPIAVALGATVLEKHFTTNRLLPGPDHAASIEPPELSKLVRNIRVIEQCLGSGAKRPSPQELEIRRVVRRSITAAKDLTAGDALGGTDLIMLRPGEGIAAEHLDEILGRSINTNLKQGQQLLWDHLAD